MYFDVKLRSTDEYLYSLSPGSFSCRTYMIARVCRKELTWREKMLEKHRRGLPVGERQNSKRKMEDDASDFSVWKKFNPSQYLKARYPKQSRSSSLSRPTRFLAPNFWLVMQDDVSRDLAPLRRVSWFIWDYPTVTILSITVPRQTCCSYANHSSI